MTTVVIWHKQRGLVVTLVVLACLLCTSSVAAPTSAERVDLTVSGEISPNDYTLYTMFLDNGQKVTLQLAVSGGVASFYFMDGGGLSQFLLVMNNLSIAPWQYYVALSALNVSAIDKSDHVEQTGIYHVAVVNSGQTDITLSGTIEATYPSSLLSVAIITAIAAVAVILILVVVHSRRTKYLQQQVDVYSHPLPEHPVPQKVAVSHPSASHQAYIDKTKRTCPRCGQKTVSTGRYCQFCGAQL